MCSPVGGATNYFVASLRPVLMRVCVCACVRAYVRVLSVRIKSNASAGRRARHLKFTRTTTTIYIYRIYLRAHVYVWVPPTPTTHTHLKRFFLIPNIAAAAAVLRLPTCAQLTQVYMMFINFSLRRQALLRQSVTFCRPAARAACGISVAK